MTDAQACMRLLIDSPTGSGWVSVDQAAALREAGLVLPSKVLRSRSVTLSEAGFTLAVATLKAEIARLKLAGKPTRILEAHLLIRVLYR